MSATAKLVYGIGRNDAGYPVSINGLIGGRNKQLWVCPFYSTWKGMMERCYSQKFQEKYPTYIGCHVVEEWHSFSNFRSWMSGQDYEGKQLDKDILHPGNKIYGPEFCVFVSGDLNKFMNSYGAGRGGFPIGACWIERIKKFQAMCCNPFTMRNEHLGVFVYAEDAHRAWKARKHQHACAYADMQEDPRIASALKLRYAV